MTEKLKLTINKEEIEIDCHPMLPLLDAIRETVGLTGTKYGCGEGECGACTVIMNDQLVMSCMVPVCQAENATIETVEGVSEDHAVTPIQEAFHHHGGAQCGICTPGMIMSAVYWLRHPDRAPGGVREALSGNLCRCTGYTAIFRAIEKVTEHIEEE